MLIERKLTGYQLKKFHDFVQTIFDELGHMNVLNYLNNALLEGDEVKLTEMKIDLGEKSLEKLQAELETTLLYDVDPNEFAMFKFVEEAAYPIGEDDENFSYAQIQELAMNNRLPGHVSALNQIRSFYELSEPYPSGPYLNGVATTIFDKKIKQRAAGEGGLTIFFLYNEIKENVKRLYPQLTDNEDIFPFHVIDDFVPDDFNKETLEALSQIEALYHEAYEQGENVFELLYNDAILSGFTCPVDLRPKKD